MRIDEVHAFCSNCGAIVDAGDAKCPNCKKTFNKTFCKKCSVCGAGVTEEDQTGCLSCGSQWGSVAFKCSECGAIYQEEPTMCSNCGIAMGFENESEEEQSSRTPCNHSSSGGVKYCPGCGVDTRDLD